MYTTYLSGNGHCIRGWLRGWGLLWDLTPWERVGIYQTQECAEKRERNTAEDGIHGGAWGFGEGVALLVCQEG